METEDSDDEEEEAHVMCAQGSAQETPLSSPLPIDVLVWAESEQSRRHVVDADE